METLTISLPGEKKIKSKKVTDRVKTFEDACAELGINAGDIVKLSVISELSGDAKSNWSICKAHHHSTCFKRRLGT